MYPGNKKNVCGKIRLLYEAMPMTYIIKKLGGFGDDFKENILDKKVEIKNLHEKIPIRLFL